MNESELRGKIVANGLNLKKYATVLGISIPTLSGRLSGKTKFKTDEITKSVECLHLTRDETFDIFLA
jgi:transcriptional regulator with XRE-family HTH domain